MTMEAVSSGRGIRIKHEKEAGQSQTIEAHYNESGTHRLDLIIDGHNVYLTEDETAFFLAWTATWYEQGEYSISSVRRKDEKMSGILQTVQTVFLPGGANIQRIVRDIQEVEGYATGTIQLDGKTTKVETVYRDGVKCWRLQYHPDECLCDECENFKYAVTGEWS